eukprot:3310509-Rhodomonas_salina.1
MLGSAHTGLHKRDRAEREHVVGSREHEAPGSAQRVEVGVRRGSGVAGFELGHEFDDGVALCLCCAQTAVAPRHGDQQLTLEEAFRQEGRGKRGGGGKSE